MKRIALINMLHRLAPMIAPPHEAITWLLL
jgi:hypothetical protein